MPTLDEMEAIAARRKLQQEMDRAVPTDVMQDILADSRRSNPNALGPNPDERFVGSVQRLPEEEKKPEPEAKVAQPYRPFVETVLERDFPAKGKGGF